MPGTLPYRRRSVPSSPARTHHRRPSPALRPSYRSRAVPNAHRLLPRPDPQPRRRQASGHPAGCRCPACTSLVAAYYSESEFGSEDDTPGPGQYEVAAMGAVGRSGPAFTIRGRTATPAAALINADAVHVPGMCMSRL
jgi:hypothetical protein